MRSMQNTILEPWKEGSDLCANFRKLFPIQGIVHFTVTIWRVVNLAFLEIHRRCHDEVLLYLTAFKWNSFGYVLSYEKSYCSAFGCDWNFVLPNLRNGWCTNIQAWLVLLVALKRENIFKWLVIWNLRIFEWQSYTGICKRKAH